MYVCVVKAIKELEIAVRSKPSPQMFMLLGRTCQNAGDHVQAIKAFDRAIEATVSMVDYCTMVISFQTTGLNVHSISGKVPMST